jgi:hypothetical protein
MLTDAVKPFRQEGAKQPGLLVGQPVAGAVEDGEGGAGVVL